MGRTHYFLDTRDRYTDLAGRQPTFFASAPGHQLADPPGGWGSRRKSDFERIALKDRHRAGWLSQAADARSQIN